MFIIIVNFISIYTINHSYSLIAEANAEVLRKIKYLEQQKLEENKLSLAQIDGRLSELRDKRDELEEEKQALLNEAKASNNDVPSIPEVEAKWYFYYQMRFIVY